jgi:hypothetical protein
MGEWVKSLGHNQREIIRRLNKENVRAQKNVRLGGEGGTPHAHGTAAHTAGLQASANLQDYVAGLPGVAQAQSFFNSPNRFAAPAGPPPGFSREASLSGDSSSMPGTFSMPSAPGEPSSSFAPPSGPPPSWSGEPIGSAAYSTPPPHVGYAPSYGSEAPSFPGSSPGPGGFGPPPAGFPTPPGPGGFGFPGPAGPGFAPPGGPPGFPGPPSPFGVPGGPPPFPGGPPPHGHHQHQGSQSGYPGSAYHGGGW